VSAGTVWSRLSAWDENLTARLMLPEAANRWRALATGIAHLGDGWLWFLGWGLAYALGDGDLRGGILRWAGAALLAGGIVGAIKLILRRERPTAAQGFYSRRYDVHSFPSGHAARLGVAAALGPLLCPGWGWLFPPCALLVVWARVALGVHYFLDVVVGLAIGLATALAVWCTLCR